MSEEDVRNYEARMQAQTNDKVLAGQTNPSPDSAATQEIKLGVPPQEGLTPDDSASPAGANPVVAAAAGIKNWLTWS